MLCNCLHLQNNCLTKAFNRASGQNILNSQNNQQLQRVKQYSIIRNQFLKVSQHSYCNMTFDYKLFSPFYLIHRLLW